MGLTISSIFSRLFGKQRIKFAMVGLNAAGKTSILYKLGLGDIITSIPTTDFDIESVEYKNITLNSWDVGVQERGRYNMWRHYFSGTRGLIFVVDSNDRRKLDEAREELARILEEDELKDAHLLVFANKQDIPDALTVGGVTNYLELHKISRRKWFVQAACATQGTGLYEGFDWLSNSIAKADNQE